MSGVTPCLPLLPVTSHPGCHVYMLVETDFSVKYALKPKTQDDDDDDDDVDNDDNNNSRSSLL